MTDENGQIRDREDEKVRERQGRDLAQESRLVEEEAYKKLLADEKERRSKEQKLYGDYLKVNFSSRRRLMQMT